MIVLAILAAAIVLSSLHEEPTGYFSLRTLLNSIFTSQSDDSRSENLNGGTDTGPAEPKPPAPPPRPPPGPCSPSQVNGQTVCTGSCTDANTYCTLKEGTTNQCDCRQNNPCVYGRQDNPTSLDNRHCLFCMGFAEARGQGEGCVRAGMCVIRNRVNNPNYRPHVSSECEAVAQGDGKQFSPYNCAGDPTYLNQGYCQCCTGKVGKGEEDEAVAAGRIAENLDCTGFNSLYFWTDNPNTPGNDIPGWLRDAIQAGTCHIDPNPFGCPTNIPRRFYFANCP